MPDMFDGRFNSGSWEDSVVLGEGGRDRAV